MSQPPALSVVVALISGRQDDLRRCLAALHAQTLSAPLDIVVPYDEPCDGATALGSEFPGVRFLFANELDTREARAGGSREHHDTLRTIGIGAATGDLIALTEDHARPSGTWCAELIAALERHPSAGAVGGAVEYEGDQLLAQAVWFCDFGRYSNPLPEGRAAFVSDSNVVYRRRALEAVASAWLADYHETVLHSALIKEGFDLCTTPRAVVWQARGRLTLTAALRERYVWARSFAGTRARLVGQRRWVLAALSPLLPIVMTGRLAGIALRRGRTGAFVACLPLILLLQSFWAIGELVGYVTGGPRPPQRRSTIRL
jgi:GT2 family glycosyltransferase